MKLKETCKRVLVVNLNDKIDAVIQFSAFSHLRKRLNELYTDIIENEQSETLDGETILPFTEALVWLKRNEGKEDVIDKDYVIHSVIGEDGFTSFTIQTIK